MSSSFQIIHKRKGMKNLVRKIIWLQAYTAVSGIWKNEGRQLVAGNGAQKKKIKLAKLASVLEEFSTWIQPKTVVIPSESNPDEKVVLKEGRRYSRPARPFIMLWKINSAWEQIRERVRKIILEYLANKKRAGKTNSKHIIDEISTQMSNLQKEQVSAHRTAENSPITQIIKGFDFALYHTGKLLNSIRGKSRPNVKGRVANQEQKLKYLTQIDELIQQLNRK